MNSQVKKFIRIGSRKIEVNDEVYKTYTQSERKERYFMNDLKREGVNIKGDKIEITKSREDSLECLESINIEFPDTKSDSVEDFLEKNILLQILSQAMKTLNEEKLLLMWELFYFDRTEREVGAILHMPSSTVHDRKIAVLKKLRNFFEKKSGQK